MLFKKAFFYLIILLNAFLPVFIYYRFILPKNLYSVYQNHVYLGSFPTETAALTYAKRYANTYILRIKNKQLLWDNFENYTVFQTKDEPEHFSTFYEAYVFSKSEPKSDIYLDSSLKPIWSENMPLPAQAGPYSVPAMNQMPYYPRGCEITSLSMLLQYNGIPASKVTLPILARTIKRSSTPYSNVNGKIYFGNPNVGFVGSMTNMSKPGYGVYHKPVVALAKRYFPKQVIDLTDSSFSVLLQEISKGHPVWIITNSLFHALPSSDFTTWYTPQGAIQITLYEHAVVITGYNSQYVYFNNPIGGIANEKMPLVQFKQAWIQMGRQAITILPRNFHTQG